MLSIQRSDALNTLPSQADALFSPRTNLPPLETLPQELDCSDGVAHMVLPGSEFINLWNFYFKVAVMTGIYERICNAAPQRHGSKWEYAIHFQTELLEGFASFFYPWQAFPNHTVCCSILGAVDCFIDPDRQTETKHSIL